MATIIIPARADLPAYEFRFDLDDEVFTLSFRFNSRMSKWIMDIKTQDGTPLRMGIPLLTAVKLLNEQRPSTYPKGNFLMMHETGLYIDSEREELGQIIKLYYQEAS
jgi:hypothetical protein